MTRTQFKLEEAKFFHALLEMHWRHIPNIEFYVSAFVSAARSVTWVMRHEYGHKAGWSEWFDSKKPSSEIRELLRKMNDVRVRSTKTDPIRTRTTAKVTIHPDDVTPKLMQFLESGANGDVKIHPIDKENKEALILVKGEVIAKARIEHVDHEIPEFLGRNAKDVCKDYLDELEALVNECQRKFG